MSLTIIHLAGPQHSGRGVKLRRLSASEIDDVETCIMRNLKPEDFMLQLQQMKAFEGMTRMVVAVTEPLPDMDAVRTAKWKKLDLVQTQDKAEFDRMFTAKDAGVLTRIFNKWHSVVASEVDDILGKAVSEVE